MYKILLLILLIIPCEIVFGQSIKNLNEWANILHIFSENTKDVTDKNFYLTNGSLADEVEEFKKLINQEFGQQLACQFPARYLLLTETFSDVTNYSLKHCKQLVEFTKSFKSKHVSLMMTSEVLNAPASAFGHVLLLLHDQKVPEMSADVIHFSAISDDSDGFFTYAYKGLTGEYDGYYLRNKFFEKYHEYSNVEQRYLFSHKLKMSAEQKEQLLFHLFELRKSKFDYYFANKNCGYRIGTLLSVIYQDSIPNNLIYTLPVEIPFMYQKYFDDTVKLPPYSAIAKYNIQQLEKLDQIAFNDIINGKEVIKSSDSEELRKAVFYYYVYNFKKNANGLPNYKENLVESKIDVTNIFEDKIQSPVDKPRASKLQLGGGRLNSNEFSSIKIRPFLTDVEMFQQYNLHESELTLLNTSLISVNNKMVIDEVDFLSVKVFDPHSKYFSNQSWQGKLAINNKNIFQERGINLNMGLGKSYEFFGLYTFLLNIGTDSNNDIYKGYFSPEINVYYYPFSKFKLSINIKKKIYEEQSINILESKLTYLINSKYDLLIKYNNYDDFDERTSLNIGYYF